MDKTTAAEDPVTTSMNLFISELLMKEREKEKGIDLVTNIDIMKAPTQRLLDLMVEFVHMKKKDITDKQKEVRDLIKKELKERFVNKKKHI